MSEASARSIDVVDASQQIQQSPQQLAEAGIDGAKQGLHLEPVKPGELGEELVTNPENYDPNNPDFTPVAAMAHEPWSLKDYGMDVEAPKPEEPTPGIDPVMAHETGTLDDYKAGSKDKPTEPSHPGYDGPVEKGKEIELHKPGELEPIKPKDSEDKDPFKRIGDAVNGRVDELKKEGNSEADADAEAHDEFWGKVPEGEKDKGNGQGTPDTDPFKRIGDAVNGRVDELKKEGNSEADADAEAHDEFWGKEPKVEKQDPGEKDPTDLKTPETETIPPNPELQAAMAELELARNELARMRAGRESSTFFSFKFSKKKVEAAFQAYEAAKTRAGEIAVNLLREKGVQGKELVSAINFGAADEVFKLIDAQYDIERKEIDGKKLKGLYDWWKQQGTKFFSLGTVKKGAIMAAVGVPVGLAAGLLAAPIAAGASAVAAGLAAGASRAIGRGLAGNAIRRNSEASDVAEGKQLYRRDQAQKLIDEMESYNQLLGTAQINEADLGTIARGQTVDVKKGNDSRARSSMLAGAAGAIAGALLGSLIADHFITPPHDPGIPKPTPPDTPTVPYNPNMDRFQGIVSARPSTAPAEFQGFFGDIQPGTPNLPSLDKVNAIWDTYKGQFNPDQGKIFNQLLGRFSTAEGFGNDWTVQHAAQIADLVKQGNSANDIIGLLGAGPENL